MAKKAIVKLISESQPLKVVSTAVLIFQYLNSRELSHNTGVHPDDIRKKTGRPSK